MVCFPFVTFNYYQLLPNTDRKPEMSKEKKNNNLFQVQDLHLKYAHMLFRREGLNGKSELCGTTQDIENYV